MPIYTAAARKPTAHPTPLFATKKLGDYAPSKVNDLHLYGIPHLREIAYDGYIKNLPAFLAATAEQKIKVTGAQGYKASLASEHLLPILAPPVRFMYKGQFRDQDQKQKWMEELGVKAEEDETTVVNGKRVPCFIAPSLTIKELLALGKKVDPVTPIKPASTNIAKARSFITCLKIISLFLSTHTYPAYGTMDETFDLVYSKSISYSQNTDSMTPATTKRPAVTQPGHGVQHKTRKTWSTSTARVIVPAAEYEDVPGVYAKQQDIHAEQVLKAKPSILDTSVNYGTPSSVPFMHGLYFPYFHDLIDPDASSITRIIRDYFLLSLGRDRSEVIEGMTELRDNVRSWCRSKSGQIIQHILLGIDLCLESQSRLYLLIEKGQYLGFVLLGCRFSIILNGSEHIPLDPADLRKELSSVTSHSNAVTGIINVLSSLDLKDGEEVDMDLGEKDYTGARMLSEDILKHKSKGDSVDQINRLLMDLSFDEPYWRMTKENLVTALETIFQDPDRVEQSWPMYLSPTTLWDTSITSSVLSAFGPSAPSFLSLGGQKYEIPLSSRDDPYSIADSRGKRPLDIITVSVKALATAIQDWNRMRKERMILQQVGERAGGHRTLRLSGEYRDEIWALLRSCVDSIEEDRADADVDTERESKRRRIVGEFSGLDDF